MIEAGKRNDLLKCVLDSCPINKLNLVVLT